MKNIKILKLERTHVPVNDFDVYHVKVTYEQTSYDWLFRKKTEQKTAHIQQMYSNYPNWWIFSSNMEDVSTVFDSGFGAYVRSFVAMGVETYEIK